MIRKLSVSVLLLTLGLSVFAKGEISLRECIRMGIERNLQLQNCRIDIQRGKTSISQARAMLLPQVNAAVQGGDYLIRPVNVTTSTPLGNDFPDNPTWGKVRSMPLNVQGAVQASMPLYNATVNAGINAARTVEEINEVGYEKARLDLAVQIAQVYFMAQATLENRCLLDGNIERMDSLRTITKAMYKQGVVLEIDYTRVDVNEKNLEAQRDEAVSLYNQQMNILRFLLNLDRDYPINVVRMPQELIKMNTEGLNEQLPELQLAQKNLELIDKQIQQVRAGYKPTVALTGQLGVTAYEEHLGNFVGSKSNWFGNSYIGVSVNVPLFDANKKKLQIRQYKHQREQARNSQLLQHSSLQQQYDNALLETAQTERMFNIQKQNLAQSTDVYNVTNIKYKEGVSSMTELLQDDIRLREAQGNLVNAHYNFNKSQVDLLKLSGNLDNYINE